MFRSARGDNIQPSQPRPAAGNYSSFQQINDNKSDSKRKHDCGSSVESDSDSDDDIIVEHVKLYTSSRHKKKHKKEKKHKKGHKSSSKKKRRRSPSFDDKVVAHQSSSKSDFFIEHFKKTLNSYNYSFEKQLKLRAIKFDVNLPLSVSHDPTTSKVLFYGESKHDEKRYYSADVREPFQRVAKERIFRRFDEGVFLSKDEMKVSETAYDPEKDNCDHTIPDDNAFEEDIFAKSRKVDDVEKLSVRQKLKHIRAEINSDGTDVEKWLQFLKLEDAEFASMSRSDRSSKAVSRFSFLERRLEIVKEGLKKVSRNSSLKLHLEYLHTLTELYGSFDERVVEYWKKLQNIHVNSLDLWQSFIQQLMHNSTNFKLPNMLAQFDVAIQKLGAISAGIFVSHQKLPGTDEFLIELVVNRSRLLMEAGRIFTVIATIQAVAEFCFFAPESVRSKDWLERLRAFEQFWNSCVPRLGDKNSKGWRNSKANSEEVDESLPFELTYETTLTERISKLEQELITNLGRLDGPNRRLAWSELEQLRSKNYWKPVRPIKKLLDEDESGQISERLVSFEDIKSSLLPFRDVKLCSKLLFKLLQIVGVVIPGLEDDSQLGLLNSILPNDFTFLRQTYTDLSDFLINFMFELAESTEIAEKEQIYVAIISTSINFLELENSNVSSKLATIRDVQTRVVNLNVKQDVKYCVLLIIWETFVEWLEVYKSLVGAKSPNVFEVKSKRTAEQKVFKDIIAIFGSSYPFEITDVRQKQILFSAALLLATRLPSSHTGINFNRVRFLSLLVLRQTNDFLNEFELTSQLIDEAREIWLTHREALLTQPSTTARNAYSFMELPDDVIFALSIMFEFEYTSTCPFSNLPIVFNRFVEQSAWRTMFRLDFAYELWRLHKCQWTNYTRWVSDAIKLYPQISGFYRHLANMFGAKPCRFRYFVEWRKMDLNSRRQHAFAMFAAEYLLFKKACETDDDLLIDSSYKRIRQIFQESASLLSNTFKPDSFVWRLWHYIERENRKISEMEKVYLLGVQMCPFSKQLLIDITLSPFTPQSKLEEIKDLADKFDIKMYTLPAEADTILEVAVKHKTD